MKGALQKDSDIPWTEYMSTEDVLEKWNNKEKLYLYKETHFE